MFPVIVVDTNIFIGALLSARGLNRQVVRGCLTRRFQPVMGTALFTEFEAVMSREELFEHCPASPAERQALFEAFLSVCRWVDIFYLWRPNLPDEADNHVLELAVAAGAKTIVTHNTRDFRRSELQFPDIEALTPEEFLTRIEEHDDDDDQIGR